MASRASGGDTCWPGVLLVSLHPTNMSEGSLQMSLVPLPSTTDEAVVAASPEQSGGADLSALGIWLQDLGSSINLD